jgi:hypothetical protein
VPRLVERAACRYLAVDSKAHQSGWKSLPIERRAVGFTARASRAMLGGLDSHTHRLSAADRDPAPTGLHPAAELGVCNQTAGIAWLADWSLLELSGRRSALDGVLRDLRGQHVRSGSPTRFRHGWLHRIGHSRALVILGRPVANEVGRVRAAACGWADIAITDASCRYQAMAVVGPSASDVAAATRESRDVMILRLAEIEFLFLVAKPKAPVLWHTLLQAGVPCGAHPVSAASIALLAAAREIVGCQRHRSER